ncbi:MAG TPA: glycosyltransferase family A protein [Gemmatimonadaceae bacterium]|nr:glycosyltransferase family A protein [Gemmatimonadaceae bacterium]
MSPLALALAGALPWIVVPLVVVLRARRSRSLDEMPAEPPPDAPPVSVIIPARDEARNIERCLRSVLTTSYPAVEVIVVDDHSTDGTGEIARAAAGGDARVTILSPPPLPEGWFGKQWACAAGARIARGRILCFTDADTVHAPDLLARSVHAIRDRRADLFSVAGAQEMGSFWERVLQPQIFAILSARYGATVDVERSPRAVDKIANGQCLFVRRDAYDAVGGHAAVKGKVAEDLALAQRVFAAGRRVGMATGESQLSTRMYESLSELVRGWGKNVYAGGREAMPGGRLGRLAFPLFLIAPPLFTLAPALALLAGAVGLAGPAVVLWGVCAAAATTLWWVVAYRRFGESPAWALLHPLGAAVLLWIVVTAIARGENVAWKGRDYRAS